MDTFGADRQRFFKSLRSSPGFARRHAGFLASAVFGKIKNRVKLALQPELGAKSRPVWLPQREINCGSTTPRALVERLPQYTLAPMAQRGGRDAAPPATAASSDPEDYLAGHRWGFLFNAMLQGGLGPRAELERIENWIVNYADKTDAAWETYSACERVANSLVFIASRGREDLNRTPSYPEFLRDSLQWVYARLEYYGEQRTNNHILNNARALVMGGVALGDNAAVAAGLKIFRVFLPRLVGGNGVLRERSSHYQFIVLNWVLDAWKFLAAYRGANQRELAFLRDHATAMAQAAQLMLLADGRLSAAIGDVSPDFTPQQTLARLSALYPEFDIAERPPAPAEIRGDWFRLCAGDARVLGNFVERSFPLPYPTHGHNDLTGFVWMAGGATLLTDPGRYRYTPDAVSLAQKSASGHNLPLVNGFAPFCESLLPNAQWWPRPYADAAAGLAVQGDAIALWHDGYARATPVSRHARTLALQPAVLEVKDQFDGSGVVEIDFCWHFSAAFKRFDKRSLTASGPELAVSIALTNAQTGQPLVPVSCETVALSESSVYGETRPSLGVRLTLSLDLPANIMTRFTLTPCAA